MNFFKPHLGILRHYHETKYYDLVISKFLRESEQYGKIHVISILGVQSTGKSSLLNNMYNLDFAVTAARTTKGINMRILNSKKKRITFILLDCEGLRALEKHNVNSTQQRKNDNRLATFILGIADISLINLIKFDHSHLSPILQMVCKSFIKFKTQDNDRIFRSARCFFVHQQMENMNNESINPQREKLIMDLDKCAQIASHMINQGKFLI